jgi:AcrR family transcriptional regulator
VSSKQEILLALLDRALEMLSEQIDIIAKQPLPADEKLRQMVQVYLRLLADNSDLSAVLLFEHRSLELAQHQRHIPNRDRFEALWRDTLDEGVKNGLFDCSDTALATRALMGVLNWTLTWYRSNGTLSIEQVADQYTTLLLNGLLKDG